IGGSSSKSPYQFTMWRVDTTSLYAAVPKIEATVRGLPGLTDVTTDLQVTNPQVYVTINRDKAATLGITANQIENTLYNAYGARQISSIYTPANQYYVVLEVAPRYQKDLSALSQLYLRSSTNE